MVRKSQRANVVTMIPGYPEESSSTTNRTRSSAIPGAWDTLFHGDYRQSLPTTLTNALKTKSLQEYPSRTFPNYRVRTGLKLSFETDGKTISAPSISQEKELAPITLEGGRASRASAAKRWRHWTGATASSRRTRRARSSQRRKSSRSTASRACAPR